MITNNDKLEEILQTGISVNASPKEIIQKIQEYWLKDTLIETNITRVEEIN